MFSGTFRNAASSAALAFALAAWMTPATAQDTAAPADEGAADRIVAEVNGEPIYESEVLSTIENLPPQVRQMPPEMVIPLVADQIATGRLITEQGLEAGLQDSDQVKQRLAEAEKRIVQEVWLDQQISERVTEDSVQQAYQSYLAANPPTEEVKARHILVETEEQAKDAIQRLADGGDFAQLADELSTDQGGGANGGDLGYFKKDEMVAPFAEAAFGMQPGQVSETPVQTQFGWHVIKVEDRRMTAPPELEGIRAELEQDLKTEIVQQIVADLRSDAEITLYGPNGEPLPAEGEAPGAAPAPAAEPTPEGDAAPAE